MDDRLEKEVQVLIEEREPQSFVKHWRGYEVGVGVKMDRVKDRLSDHLICGLREIQEIPGG